MCTEFKKSIFRKRNSNSNEQLNMAPENNRSYKEAFAEAVVCLKNKQPIPEELIEKAIGKEPSSCLDTPDMDSMMMQIEECNRYRMERENFLDNVRHTVHPRY